MTITYLHKIGWLVALVLLQVLILNNLHIGGYATPFLYLYLILKFEADVPANRLMLWAFCLGIIVDIFSDTPGLNAASTVLIAFIRPTLLRLFVPRDLQDTFIPSIRSMGITSFLKYTITAILVHHTVLFSLEAFSFAHLPALLIRITSSTLFTMLCVLAIEMLLKKEQR